MTYFRMSLRGRTKPLETSEVDDQAEISVGYYLAIREIVWF